MYKFQLITKFKGSNLNFKINNVVKITKFEKGALIKVIENAISRSSN